MGVSLRGKKFHYRFQLRGADYSGVCVGCEITENTSQKEIDNLRRKALAFEAERKAQIEKENQETEQLERDVRRNRTVRALVENYRYELTGGKPISLGQACALAASKPSRKKAAPSFAEQRETYFADFVAFMAETFPEVTLMADVHKVHCEAYVSYLVEHGRFVKEVRYGRPSGRRVREISYRREYGLSPKTVRSIVGVCRWVFRRLMEDAGLVADPWAGVQLPEPAPVDREIFTPAELRLIWKGIQDDPFCYPLFVVAANSGMTEGDICTLKWEEVEWGTGYIRRKRRKTGADIRLPLLPELADYLRTVPHLGEYVFPEHARMYLRTPSIVSDRVKNFLNGLGLVTVVRVPGRRSVSVKDLHSMRHVFCYRAKRAGIPESVIAKFVGHKVLAMTRHYADHDTDEELRAEIKKLRPLFVGDAGAGEPESFSRRKLAELAYSLPLKTVEELIARCSKMLTA